MQSHAENEPELKPVSFMLWSFVLCASLLLTLPLQALKGPWVAAEKAQVRLLAESATTGQRDTLMLGLEFKLEPGWKIYWRSPGEAGLPPEPNYEGSRNLASANMEWPKPARYSLQGIDSIAYDKGLIFPIRAKLDKPGQPLKVAMDLSYLICADICIPGKANLALALASGDFRPSSAASLIQTYQALVPRAEHESLKILDMSLEEDGEAYRLLVTAETSTVFDKADAFVEAPEGFFFHQPAFSASENRKAATLAIKGERLWLSNQSLSLDDLRVTLVNQQEAIEVAGLGFKGLSLSVAPSSKAQGSDKGRQGPGVSGTSLGLILMLALIGGLILNLMPCVLPVLSIKLLSIAEASGKSRGDIRRGFLATTIGILVSFLALALGLILMKQAGAAVGWGVQFQQPLFILSLTFVMLLFAGNLFGWFEIRLPQSVATWSGQAGQNANPLLRDFSHGALATLLATPCSAPFLGTALSFALAQSAGLIVLVFLFIGLGMALPFILVSAFPQTVAFLPKPGTWMLKLRLVLGLLLLATTIWLLSILIAQLGWPAFYLAMALSALVLLSLFFAARIKTTVAFMAPLALGFALLFAPPILKQEIDLTKQLEKPWVVFDQVLLQHAVAEGKLVYVDVTADWCVTCKVNKAVVFADARVKTAFGVGEDKSTANPDLIAMQADWTNPNPEIQAYLQSFGRAGIPFNAIYSARYPEGQPLPELLTPSLVLNALEDAG